MYKNELNTPKKLPKSNIKTVKINPWLKRWNMKKSGVVYVLYDNGVLYVGETAYLEKRLYRHIHCAWNEMPKNIEFAVVYSVKGGRKERWELEKVLKKELQPRICKESNRYV